MAAQKVVTGPHRQPHQPVLERRFPAKTAQLLVRLGPDFLHDVFDFRFAPGIAAGGRKNTRGIAGHQRFERGRIALEHRGYKLRIAMLHQAESVMRRWKNNARAFGFCSASDEKWRSLPVSI